MPNIKYNLNATTANNFNSLLIDAGYTNAVLNQENVYFTLSEISEEKYNAAIHIAFLKMLLRVLIRQTTMSLKQKAIL